MIKSGGGPVMSVGCSIGDAHYLTWWDDNNGKFKTECMYLSQVYAVEMIEVEDGRGPYR